MTFVIDSNSPSGLIEEVQAKIGFDLSQIIVEQFNIEYGIRQLNELVDKVAELLITQLDLELNTQRTFLESLI